MMRGDTLTAGIGRFTGAVHSSLIEYRMCGVLFPCGLRKKGTLGKNLAGGNKFGGLGVVRDTGFERDLKVDFCSRDLTIENFRFHRQSEVDNQEAGPAVSRSDMPYLTLNRNPISIVLSKETARQCPEYQS